MLGKLNPHPDLNSQEQGGDRGLRKRAKQKKSHLDKIQASWGDGAYEEFKGCSLEALSGLVRLCQWPWGEVYLALCDANRNRQQGKGHPRERKWPPAVVASAREALEGKDTRGDASTSGGRGTHDVSSGEEQVLDSDHNDPAQTLTPRKRGLPDSSDVTERLSQRPRTETLDDEELMANILPILQELFDPQLVRFVQDFGDAVGSRMSDSNVILGSCRIAQRGRVALRIYPSTNTVDVFDPLMPNSDRDLVESQILRCYRKAFGADGTPDISYSAPVMSVEGDCTIAVLMIIAHYALDTNINPSMDTACCRRMLNNLCYFRVASGNDVLENTSSLVAVPEVIQSLAQEEHISLADCARVLDGLALFAQEMVPVLEQKKAGLLMRKGTPCAKSCLNLLRHMKAKVDSSDKLLPAISDGLIRAEADLKETCDSERMQRELDKTITNARALGSQRQ